MSALAVTDDLFFHRADSTLDRTLAERITADALQGTDDGELFLEYRESESISMEDGRIRAANYDTATGFGLRAVLGDETGYAHSGELSEAALKRAASTVSAVRGGRNGTASVGPRNTNARLYSDASPLGQGEFGNRAATLGEIDAYARGRDARVVQVMASLHGEWQAVQIVRADGERTADLRPLVRLNVSVVVERDGKRESGTHGLGGREGFDRMLSADTWKAAVDEALRQAVLKLDAVPAPAGEMEVVLGAGWPGILLHEAIGHGLEGDFNRKKTSAFAGLMGQRVGSPGVTVVDDGTLPDRRGSLTIDDEGTPTNRTVLIEDGILTGYLQDRLNARLMGVRPTGKRAPRKLRAFPHAAHDQHRDAERKPHQGRDDFLGQTRSLRGKFRRRPSGHHLRQIRLLRQRSLPDRERQSDSTRQRRHPDRQRPRQPHESRHDRRRHGTGPGHRHLRQERPRRTGRCGAAYAENAWTHHWWDRYGQLGIKVFCWSQGRKRLFFEERSSFRKKRTKRLLRP